MIKNKENLEELERKLVKEENLSFKQSMKIYEGLLKEARILGKINSKNIMEDIEAELRIARAINGLTNG